MSRQEFESDDLRSEGWSYWTMTLVFAGGLAMGHCWWVGDNVAFGTLVAVALGGLVGYCCGFWRSIASSVGMFAGFQLSGPTSARLIPILEGQLNREIDSATGLAISGVAAGIVATLAVLLIGAFLRRNATFKQYDQYCGLISGIGATTACVALLFWVLLSSESKLLQARQVAALNRAFEKEPSTQAIAIDRMVGFLKATKGSYVMLGLKQWNPFTDVEYFRQLKTKIEASIDRTRSATGAGTGLMGSMTDLLDASVVARP